jgi:hypothetical protein
MDKSSYAKYIELPLFSKNCIGYLIENNELIWKLIKYSDPDAWMKPDLTEQEKRNLIFKGVGDATNFRVFMDVGQPHVWTVKSCVIRISPHSINSINYVRGMIRMSFEVFSHYDINHLTNYQTRVDTIAQQFLEVFNGATIGGIGQLFFDGMVDQSDRVYEGGQLPHKGKIIIMSNNSN